ncbi:translational GTPase TypA [bacterium]|nr:translational GTPase TypA [bacterium]
MSSELTDPTAIRNIAIIAHVDHGKTTLVDHLFRQSGALQKRGSEDVDRVMDSMDLERERGITIAAKNCSVDWHGTKINILDTPGHSDFGGEVERSLSMVDGAILLVDAAEGPLPQTRFVLKKALELKLEIIVCINKIDRSDARADEVLNEIYDLFIDLDAEESQIEFPVLYLVAKDGIAKRALEDADGNLSLLLDQIVETIPAPQVDVSKPFRMLVANLDYSDYLGRLAVGRIFQGKAKAKDSLVRIDRDGTARPLKVSSLQSYQGIQVQETAEALAGDIVLLAGLEEVEIGDTITEAASPEALPRINVDQPTIGMTFGINTSPLAGREGKIVQGQRIRERLEKEILYNVSLQVEFGQGDDSFLVKGRGELQLAILIETMRREGFELSVGRPEVLYREEDGKKLEPIEHLLVDCDEAFLGVVTEKLSLRKGKMTNMVNHGTGRVRVEFSIPSRGLIGYRSQYLTDTRGTGIMNSSLEGYEEHRGDFPSRQTGSLVADRTGEAVAYGLFHLQPRGRLFVRPGEPVYEGLIIGEHARGNDLNVNPCKAKKLSNMRAAGKDENIQLTPVPPMSLEKAIEFIREDELIEVTPESIRLRKVKLNPNDRRDLL